MRKMKPALRLATLTALALTCLLAGRAIAEDPWVVYEGQEGPGKGKHIVLISGDEEYRSEEALPQLAKILAVHHGFKCTVLFAIDPDTGLIDPNNQNNVPGLEALKTADLMIIFTRFRALPDEQMQQIDDYLKTGRPVIGIRTATHAFQFRGSNKWAHYGNGYGGELKEWAGGFGRLVLGEQWVNHHGSHRHESTRGLIAPTARKHPINRGLSDGDVWGPSDVYTVRLPLPGDSRPVVLGQVMKRKGQYDENDPSYGMRPDDGPPVEGAKNDPMMPIAWTKTYQIPGGQPGRSFTSTLGAATDLVAEGSRRLLVNAVYWSLKMGKQVPATGTKVDLVGQYNPTAFAGHPAEYWADRKMKPADFRLD